MPELLQVPETTPESPSRRAAGLRPPCPPPHPQQGARVTSDSVILLLLVASVLLQLSDRMRERRRLERKLDLLLKHFAIEPLPLSEAVKALVRENNKIRAIKRLR